MRGKPPPDSLIQSAVSQLIELGYLKFAPSDLRAQLRDEMLDSMRNGYLDTTWDDDCVGYDKRSYPADEEELAEGRIAEHIRLMWPVLLSEGVSDELVVQDDFGEW